MREKLFGTDGVRGHANVDLTAELAMALGAAATHVLGRSTGRVRVLVGRDPRRSGDMLEAALTAGALAMGAEVWQSGVIPTPGVAYLARAQDVDLGIVISASHNPADDNGIKLIAGDGCKLADAVEAQIEYWTHRAHELPRPPAAAMGRIVDRRDLREDYLNYVLSTGPKTMAGMKVVVDCANGAASFLAPELFRRLGANVISLCDEPDGFNINVECGSLHPQRMQEKVLAEGAQAGFSFDGDGDRVVLADETGKIVDGDYVLALCGLHLHRKGELPGSRIVGTVMSNMGLEVAFREQGIELLRAPVGDRYVWEEMVRSGALLGGEKSGHIIFAQYMTTGDGMVTALQVVKAMQESGESLSGLARCVSEFPQLLVNVRVRTKAGWNELPELQEAIAGAEKRLQNRGRVLVRPSGTEWIIRVMAEGPDLRELEEITYGISDIIRRKLG